MAAAELIWNSPPAAAGSGSDQLALGQRSSPQGFSENQIGVRRSCSTFKNYALDGVSGDWGTIEGFAAPKVARRGFKFVFAIRTGNGTPNMDEDFDGACLTLYAVQITTFLQTVETVGDLTFRRETHVSSHLIEGWRNNASPHEVIYKFEKRELLWRETARENDGSFLREKPHVETSSTLAAAIEALPPALREAVLRLQKVRLCE